MPAVTEKQFMGLKAQLDRLSIHEKLTVEGAPLAERLLARLQAASARGEEQTRRLDQATQELGLAKNQLFPLRKENSRVVRENNQLHLELIKRSEASDARERRWKADANALRGELRDARFATGKAYLARTTPEEMHAAIFGAAPGVFGGDGWYVVAQLLHWWLNAAAQGDPQPKKRRIEAQEDAAAALAI